MFYKIAINECNPHKVFHQQSFAFNPKAIVSEYNATNA